MSHEEKSTSYLKNQITGAIGSMHPFIAKYSPYIKFSFQDLINRDTLIISMFAFKTFENIDFSNRQEKILLNVAEETVIPYVYGIKKINTDLALEKCSNLFIFDLFCRIENPTNAVAINAIALTSSVADKIKIFHMHNNASIYRRITLDINFDIFWKCKLLTRENFEDVFFQETSKLLLYKLCPFRNDPEVRRIFLTETSPEIIVHVMENLTRFEVMNLIKKSYDHSTIYTKTKFRKDPEIRKLLLNEASVDNIPNIVQLLENPTVEEIKLALTLCVDIPEVFAACVRKDDKEIIDFISTKLSPSDMNAFTLRFFPFPSRMAHFYKQIPNPTLDETIEAMEETDDPIDLFKFCQFKNDKTVREIFIKKTSNNKALAFDMLSDVSAEETVWLLQNASRSELEYIIYRSDLNNIELRRKIIERHDLKAVIPIQLCLLSCDLDIEEMVDLVDDLYGVLSILSIENLPHINNPSVRESILASCFGRDWIFDVPNLTANEILNHIEMGSDRCVKLLKMFPTDESVRNLIFSHCRDSVVLLPHCNTLSNEEFSQVRGRLRAANNFHSTHF